MTIIRTPLPRPEFKCTPAAYPIEIDETVLFVEGEGTTNKTVVDLPAGKPAYKGITITNPSCHEATLILTRTVNGDCDVSCTPTDPLKRDENKYTIKPYEQLTLEDVFWEAADIVLNATLLAGQTADISVFSFHVPCPDCIIPSVGA